MELCVAPVQNALVYCQRTSQKVTVFWVKWSQAQTYCGSPNLSPSHPKQGHSLNVSKFNANNKIRPTG
jgi:hypothetical protein